MLMGEYCLVRISVVFRGRAVPIVWRVLVSQGIEVVRKGRRREVDPHWFRGLSYLKIGWRWVKRALSMGLRLCKVLRLDGGEDPEPSMASRRDQRRLKYSFEVVWVLV